MAPLFVQFPPIEWVNELPEKVVPEPRVTFPVILIASSAVADIVPEVSKFP